MNRVRTSIRDLFALARERLTSAAGGKPGLGRKNPGKRKYIDQLAHHLTILQFLEQADDRHQVLTEKYKKQSDR